METAPREVVVERPAPSTATRSSGTSRKDRDREERSGGGLKKFLPIFFSWFVFILLLIGISNVPWYFIREDNVFTRYGNETCSIKHRISWWRECIKLNCEAWNQSDTNLVNGVCNYNNSNIGSAAAGRPRVRTNLPLEDNVCRNWRQDCLPFLGYNVALSGNNGNSNDHCRNTQRYWNTAFAFSLLALLTAFLGALLTTILALLISSSGTLRFICLILLGLTALFWILAVFPFIGLSNGIQKDLDPFRICDGPCQSFSGGDNCLSWRPDAGWIIYMLTFPFLLLWLITLLSFFKTFREEYSDRGQRRDTRPIGTTLEPAAPRT